MYIDLNGCDKIRTQLAERVGKRCRYTGVFVRFGTTKTHKMYTICLRDIIDDTGDLITDHVWLNYNNGFKQIFLERGDVIEFKAAVKKYTRRNENEIDYTLNKVTNIRKVKCYGMANRENN